MEETGLGETSFDQRRYLVSETAIGSLMNIIMSLAACVAAGGGRIGPPTLPGGLVQTFMVAFMSVLLATLLTRMRQRRGRVVYGRQAHTGIGRLAPRNAVLRAASAGTVCLLIAGPIVWALAPGVVAAAPSPAEVGVATAAYAILLSLMIVPAALMLALNDELAT